jgi:hypothetical protein
VAFSEQAAAGGLAAQGEWAVESGAWIASKGVRPDSTSSGSSRPLRPQEPTSSAPLSAMSATSATPRD